MPLYDYQCKKCQKVTEVRHGFTDVHQAPCPDCGGTLARVFNPAGIVFKGSGFYITDSRKSGGDSSAKSGGDSSAKSSADSSAKGSGDRSAKGDGSAAPAPAASAPAASSDAKKSDAA